MRTEVFNYKDAAIEIWTEDAAGEKDTQLTDDYIYASNVALNDSATVSKHPQSGAVGNRNTVINRDYVLSMSRLHSKADEDFDIIGDPTTPTYFTLIIVEVNGDNPNFAETRELTGCVLGNRNLRLGDDVSVVPLQWIVGEYVPPS